MSQRNCTLPFYSSGFKAGGPPKEGNLTFTLDELAHAMFTTGRSPADQNAHGKRSCAEFFSRMSLIRAYLSVAPSSRLEQTELAKSLDQSEKAYLSYVLGQAVTGLFCTKELKFQFLMHVDRYGKCWNVKLPPGKVRPDLFGFKDWHLNDWVVAEAKGRSQSPRKALKQSICNQKNAINSINNSQQILSLGCVIFLGAGGKYTLEVIDPDETIPDSLSLQIGGDQLLLSYYKPFLEAISTADRTGSDDGTTYADFEDLRLRLGLNTALFNRTNSAIRGNLEGFADNVSEILSNQAPDQNSGTYFPDGSVFRTYWDELQQQDV